MNPPPAAHPQTQIPRRATIGLIVGWLLITIKCAVAPTLMARWHVPINPAWVIVPTLLFAALVSLLVVTHDWAGDRD